MTLQRQSESSLFLQVKSLLGLTSVSGFFCKSRVIWNFLSRFTHYQGGRGGHKFLNAAPNKRVSGSSLWIRAGSWTALTIRYSRRETAPPSRIGLNTLSASIPCLWKQSFWTPSLRAAWKPKLYREAPMEKTEGPWLSFQETASTTLPTCECTFLRTDPPAPFEPHQMTLKGRATDNPDQIADSWSNCWGPRSQCFAEVGNLEIGKWHILPESLRDSLKIRSVLVYYTWVS